MKKEDSILTLQRIPHYTKPSVSSERTRGETTSFWNYFYIPENWHCQSRLLKTHFLINFKSFRLETISYEGKQLYSFVDLSP